MTAGIVSLVSPRTLKALGAVFLFLSLAIVAAAAATHFLGQAVLESMVGLLGMIVLLGAS